jgi:hypothetical protein
MKLLIVIHLHLLVFIVSSGATKSLRYELSSINEINGNVTSSFKASSVQKCVAVCDTMYGCLSVYFHNETQQCNITDYYPLDNIKSGIPSNVWTIFFQRNLVSVLIFTFENIFVTPVLYNGQNIDEILKQSLM